MVNHELIEIGTGKLRAGVAPQFGGILSYLQFEKNGSWHDLCFNARDLLTQGKKALFVMAPLTARTMNGKFPWPLTDIKNTGKKNSEEFDLRADWNPHAIHCWAPRLPWEVVEVSPTQASIRVRSRNHPQVSYPSAFEVAIVYEIKNSALEVSTTISNVGDSSMPATGGTHPMFHKKILGSDKIQLQLNAPLWFPPRADYPNDPMPGAALTAVPEDLDFSQTKDAVTGYDCTLANWTGPATVTWPEVGFSLVCIDIGGNCPLIHYWHIPSRDTWAIEPLLGVADAPNVAQNFSGTGLRVLEAGESIATSHRFEVDIECSK